MIIINFHKCISTVIFLITQNPNIVDERILRTYCKHVTTICLEYTGKHTQTHTHIKEKEDMGVYQNGKNRKDDDNHTDMNIVLTCYPGIIIEQ